MGVRTGGVGGGEGGIRTRGAFAHRFSRAAPSTTRTPLRGRGYQTSTARPVGPASPVAEILHLPTGVVISRSRRPTRLVTGEPRRIPRTNSKPKSPIHVDQIDPTALSPPGLAYVEECAAEPRLSRRAPRGSRRPRSQPPRTAPL